MVSCGNVSLVIANDVTICQCVHLSNLQFQVQSHLDDIVIVGYHSVDIV